ncbi:TetR family transcriptional regulator [Polaromonas hydrogenivorans]|uniref:TetR family transcriptional regulator n=1 Tax=Polaromonas hydrogenivorans TaxID=335476 RepID=A0AAU7LV86_9BURK
MARRTKEEALVTRNKLLDAAECLFQSQGVSRTTLQDIALRAGATRGAVYWHFKDKADLFNAMMERVTLPLEAYFNHEAAPAETSSDAYPLERMRNAILKALNQIVNDQQTRRVLEVATQKVEYIEELKTIRLRHLTVRNGFLCRVQQGLDAACRHENLKLPLSSALAAQGLHALIDGLIQNWLLDPQAFDLLEAGQSTMDIYFTGLGFGNEPQSLAPTAGKK